MKKKEQKTHKKCVKTQKLNFKHYKNHLEAKQFTKEINQLSKYKLNTDSTPENH